MISILWLRRDLRLADHPALMAAVRAGAVIPVYILDDETPKHRRMGGASRWWLHHSLASLNADLQSLGSRLILRRGESSAVLSALASETGASAIHAMHLAEPWWRNADRAVKAALPEGVQLILHHGNYLMPPGSVTTGSGGPFKIYTPFWRALSAHMPPAPPLPAPEAISAPDAWPKSDVLADWALLPSRPDWAGAMRTMWSPGEAGAHERLQDFLPRAKRYDEDRNFPSVTGTSFLSPHLHFGEISPSQCWHAAMAQGGSVEVFLKELVWRDYSMNIVMQYPDLGSANARPAYDAMPWRDPAEPQVQAELMAWQQGRTGYPIVDAGMRELWATGWMHNRVRMIAASFLVKHLLIDWRHGEQWFWDTLVDADYASNAVNWQWTAGTGVDSNMFVRIMAPLSQSEKFDATAYIRKWVPELAGLDAPYIHDPEEFGRRPKGYPAKVVAHREGRERALAAHTAMKGPQ